MPPWSTSTSVTTLTQKDIHENQIFSPEREAQAPVLKEKPPQPDSSKGSYRLPLGSYRAMTAPTLLLLSGYLFVSVTVSNMEPHLRVKEWPLMGAPLPILAMCLIYIAFSVVWGPNLMRNREPLGLYNSVIIYNALQVILSVYMFYEGGVSGWFFDYKWFNEPYVGYTDDPNHARFASVTWVYFISKIFDFADTIIFVLNKKYSNISMLHMIHHSSMCFFTWFGAKYQPGGHLTFMGFVNSFVHIVMYFYYFLASLGPEYRHLLWWKHHVTQLQIVQFVMIFLHTVPLLFVPTPHTSFGLVFMICLNNFIFLSLFLDFYYRAYLKRKSSKKN